MVNPTAPKSTLFTPHVSWTLISLFNPFLCNHLILRCKQNMIGRMFATNLLDASSTFTFMAFS